MKTGLLVISALIDVISSSQSYSSPYGHACEPDGPAAKLPFCNHTHSIEDRLTDLINRLTLSEKIGLISNNGLSGCAMIDLGVPRLGIPVYSWGVEANTALSCQCLKAEKCATVFSSPAGLAASFNSSLWKKKGEIISDEARAMNNLHGQRGTKVGNKLGLNIWGPNINILRDPRFGRNSELPSEDPLLNGLYAKEIVKAIQEGSDSRYVKIVAALKHYTAYSRQGSNNDANITPYDLHDTYLPQYKLGFVEGGALQVMCSYNAVNGVPMCANAELLQKQIRIVWDRPEVTIVSDCGAVGGVFNNYKYTKTMGDGFSAVLKAGLDLDNANEYFQWMGDAIKNKSVSPHDLDLPLRRTLRLRFKTGMFDPLDDQVYTKLGIDDFNSSKAWAFNLEAATQALVLLKNEDGTLPMRRDGVALAVVGPHADHPEGLFSDYSGDQKCYSPNPADRNLSCVETISNALRRYNAGVTTISSGVGITSNDTSQITAALDTIKNAEVVVLAVGLDNTVERENIPDRTSLILPGLQQNFSQQVFDTASQLGIPVVCVVLNGGQVSLELQKKYCSALVEAFYPGQRGAEALARTLFGLENRWGRLPYTIYPEDFVSLVREDDFSMTGGVGRTYRYWNGQTVYPFGHGLSYSDFKLELVHEEPLVYAREDDEYDFTVHIENQGPLRGDEVILVTVEPLLGTAFPGKESSRLIRRLTDFDRVTLDVNEHGSLSFTISDHAFWLRDDKGVEQRVSGSFLVKFEGSSSNVSAAVIIT